MKEIIIDPITRLEGHGNVSIFLSDKGEVENAYLKIPELRGFEKFCIGRRAELMPQLTTRICGVCPVAHHFAAVKALDQAFNVEPTDPAKKLRELIKHRAYGQKITEIIGGKATHPVCGLPGGISKALSEENRQEIEKMATSCVDFAQFTLKIFHDIVLGNTKYVELIRSLAYTMPTYYMGMVDE